MLFTSSFLTTALLAVTAVAQNSNSTSITTAAASSSTGNATSTISTGTATANLTGATSAPGVISPQYALTGFEKCTVKNGMPAQFIKDAFSEMITMLQGDFLGNYPDFDWNGGAAQDYWGPYSRIASYQQDIKDNLNRAAAVSYQYWLNPFAPRLHVRCDDPLNECSCNGGSGVVEAYTITHDPHINFCPGFFALNSLDTAVDNTNQQNLQGYVGYYHNRAETWAHELMHIAEIGHPASNYPGIIDVPVQGWPGISYNPSVPSSNTGSYGDYFTKWLAQSSGNLPSDPLDNADNYALFYVASYVQTKKGYYPSKRQVPISPTTINGLNASDVGATNLNSDSPLNDRYYCYKNPHY